MKWKCSKCDRENSSCKAYCKCGIINPKYKNATKIPKQNCFKSWIIDNIKFDDVHKLTSIFGYMMITLGITVIAVAANMLWPINPFIPMIIDVGIIGFIAYVQMGYLC